jgi:RimJ/RimL family protein N-acetyltransferase
VKLVQNIETERLLLAVPEPSHARQLAQIGNDRLITDNLATMPFPYRYEDALSWISAVQGMSAGAAFVIIEKQTGQVLGCCGSGPIDDKDEIDFGYWLGVPFWRQGFATEAGGAVLDYVFGADQFAVITTDCQIDNDASLRVLEKLGFEVAGHRYRFSAATGTKLKTFKMKLFLKDWRQQGSCTSAKTV